MTKRMDTIRDRNRRKRKALAEKQESESRFLCDLADFVDAASDYTVDINDNVMTCSDGEWVYEVSVVATKIA